MGEAKNTEAVEAFIRRWQGREGGQERANYVSFLNELIALLGLPPPDPADATHEHNDYVFERAVRKHKDEGDSHGRIDLYRKNSFVLEAKQSRLKGIKKVPGQNDLFTAEIPEDSRGRRGADRAWDVLMLNAKRQAEEYARALPTAHGWPPFILICDVGHCIEVYADFSGQGKNYTQFPDRQTFRIYLEDLRNENVRERLRKIWLDPASLDPAQASARVTRDIAKRLAQVSLALEKKKYPAQDVAMFLMRCLFTMFAEDVGLLPEKSFKEVLEECEKNPEIFRHDVTQLWEAMNGGGWAHALKQEVKKFNGEFFKSCAALPLGREEIGELRQAASYSWKEVDPSIFGTLLEQALDPEERQRLGAHYTPRAYVERLVVATIIEPLREDWRNVQATAETKRASGDLKGAAAEVQAFHENLCETRVLDPACGTGNFLYVSLELMKRLEGEVLEALLDLGGQEALRGLGSHSVDPHQFLGLEINPRAAAIAELVLWIGYLQWHFRTRGGPPEEPILRAFKNIQVKNAVLTWDGEPVPKVVDNKETYPNARRPEWPAAEFIVGNPPFTAGQDFRREFGEAYTQALWSNYKHIGGGADLVMYWWDRAAELLTRKGTVLRRFGLVTTRTITHEFSGRVVARHLNASDPVSIVMAIPNHPWTRGRDAAAVRIAIFGENQPKMRNAIASLGRYIGTVDTSRHRIFSFLEERMLCDDKVVVIASSDAFDLGVLSSNIHCTWSNRSGVRLGVGNDPVYASNRCFDPFPFPDANNIQKQTIRAVAEELDAHRKRVLGAHPHLTLTRLYNVLEKLRSGTKPDALDEDQRSVFDDGLVLIMKELHDRLDIAVTEAYHWPADLSDDEILSRLVALNRERSEEEKRGLVRWLRPEYQIPRFAKRVDKQAVKEEGAQLAAELIAAVEQKPSFPSGAVEQTAAVFAALATAGQPLDAMSLAAQFKRTKTTEKKVGDVLASLARLGYVTSEDGQTFALRRVA